MTCSKNFGRLLQASCLGLIGMLTVVGCGGSENPAHNDAAPSDGGGSKVPNLTASTGTVSVGTVDVGKISTAATVVITNNGTGAGVVTVTPSGVTASGCAGNLAVNAPCTLSITATPSVAGPITGSVSVVIAGGNTLTIGVTGNAVPPGNFTLDKTAIDLGPLAVGQVAQATVTVTAGSALTGLTTTVQGADVKPDAASTCTATLGAGLTCTVVVDFSMATAGTPIGDAILVSQGGVTKTVPITATVLALAKLSASPLSGALVAAPGATSAPLSINVGNTGGMTTGQIVVAISGANAADFKIVSDTCSIVNLAGGATCAVAVVYTPAATATLAEAATLTITDKGAAGSVATVALSGTPQLPSNLKITGGPDLGQVAPGGSGSEVVFTVTNTSTTASGAVTATVGSSSVTISSNTCATKATLIQNDTCTIGLKLTPPSTALASSISTLLTVSSASGDTTNVMVTGTILSGVVLSATPASVSFGSVPANQQSAVKTVTITNGGATATSILSATLSGTGAAQVVITGNTCTGVLAPAATCTVSVQYSPTDTTGVSGQITVTDGAATVSVPMVGTGLAPSVFTLVTDTSAFSAFGPTVVGYTSSPQSVHLQLVSSATTDSGAITLTIGGANAADYATVPANTNCTLLQAGQNCDITVAFTPGAVGASAATLTVTGAKGGTYTFDLKGTGLALVQLVPLGQTATTIATPYTGLDFGQQPNATLGNVFAYRVVVRGATNPAATSTVPSIAMAPGTPPDFTYVTGTTVGDATTWAPAPTNPCNPGPTLTLPADASSSPWIVGAKTSTNPSIAPNAPVSTLNTDEQSTVLYWTCDFYVQFSPTSGKSATPKTATLTATASAGGTATLTLTGTASGPLTITPSVTFDPTPLGTSSADVQAGNRTLTVVNKAVNSISQGPLSVALGGANAADFAIVSDGCSGQPPLVPSGGHCDIVVAFTPSVAAVETATLTVTASNTGETAQATLKGTGSASSAITVTPTAVAPAAVDFGSVAQNNVGVWTSFTVTNPATGTETGPLAYSLGSEDPFELYTPAAAGVTAYPAGFCGDPSGGAQSTSLVPGATCIIQVRFIPTLVGAASGSLTVGSLAAIPLKGMGTAQLVLSGSAITTVNSVQTLAFGNVGVGATGTQTFTVTNNGAATSAGSVALTLSNNAADPAVFAAGLPPHFSPGTTGCGSTLAGGQSCQMTLIYTGVALETVSQQIVISNSTPLGTTNPVNASLVLTAKTVNPALLALSGFDYYTPPTPADGSGQAIDLGATPIGTSTGVLTLVFVNNGAVAATGLQASWPFTNPPGNTDFSIAAENQGTCFGIGGTLAPQQTCTVNVRCTPSALGDRVAELQLNGLAAPGPVVKLHATGIAPTNVYAFAQGGSNSFYNFVGATTALPGAGAKAYFTLVNGTTSPIPLGTSTTDFTGGSGTTLSVIGVALPTTEPSTDFALSKPTGVAGIANPCGTTLSSGGQCTFAVTFTPTWNDTDHLYRWANVTTSVGSATDIVGVFGRVQMPAMLQLSAAPSVGQVTVTAATTSVAGSVDFGQILTGQLSSEVFTITNIGDVATAGNVGLKMIGTGSYAVLGTSTCGSSPLAPGAAAACTVTVNSQLTSSTGTRTGLSVQAVDLGVPTATGEESLQTFDLQAEVVNQANLTLNPTGTTFATSTPAGSTDAERVTITVANGDPANDDASNRQNTTALIVTLSDSTNFAVDSASTCLNPSTQTYKALPLTASGVDSESCTIIVKFTPQAAGAKSTTVSVSATTGGTPTPVSLTGTGLSTLTSDASANPAAPTTFTITHGGSGTTGLLTESLTGTNASAFVISDDQCYGTSLTGNGDTCQVTVTFVGTCSATTAQTATLKVTDGTANSTVSIPMSVGGATAGCP